MFYLENNHLYRYYCQYDNKLFKTEQEYLDYLKDNNIQPEEIWIWRMAKISSKNHFDKDGSWIKFLATPDTIIFDERDISQYYVEDNKAKERLLKCYEKYNDFYVDRCYFDGYDNISDYTYKDSEEEIPQFDAIKENPTYAFYVVSYLPDDENIRQERLSAHTLQIKNMKRLAPNTRIYVIAQNWKDDEYMDDPQITYYKYEKLGAGKARNIALELLYESNYVYGVVTDDDITIKETDSAKQFFAEIRETPQKFIDMDIIQSRCLCYDMLDYTDIEHANIMSTNWYFKHEYEGQVHMCFIKNFRKYYSVDEYQREDINPKDNTGFDDTDFFLMLNSKNYKVYRAMFLYRYLGCMAECQSVVEDTSNGCFIYDNLTIARLRWLNRLSSGGWDYWALRKPLSDVYIPRNTEGDVFNELSGHLIDELKQRYIRNQQNINKAVELQNNDEKVKSGEVNITDLDII